jgi:hypothetical protein
MMRVVLLVTMVCMSVGCAEKQRVVRPRANPKGQGIVVLVPAVRLAEGTTCGEEVQQGVASRVADAAKTALTSAGFRVTDDATSAAFAAGTSVELSYCSEAGIVNGVTAFELNSTARGKAGTVWRSSASGDLARPETAASALDELVQTMLYDDKVIGAVQ